MAQEHGPIGQQELFNRVYKGPNKSGDNVDGLVGLNYIWDGSNWQRMTAAAGGSDTQYTDGNVTPATPTGTMPVFDNSGTITSVSVVNPLPVAGSFSASAAVANDSWGQANSLTNGSTANLVSIASSTAGFQIKGLICHGTGDGYFSVAIAGATVLSGRTRWSQPTVIIPLPNGISVPLASAVTLQVTNESGSTANYEGTLLGQ